MLRRNVQGATLVILSIRNVKVRSIQVIRIAIASAVEVAAAAGGFRQAALNHDLGGPEESLDEPLLTHSLILRYAYLFLLPREK